jgi:hypothetical protein
MLFAQPLSLKTVSYNMNVCGENMDDSDFLVASSDGLFVVTTYPVSADSLYSYYNVYSNKGTSKSLKLPANPRRHRLESAHIFSHDSLFLLFNDEIIVINEKTTKVFPASPNTFNHLYATKNRLYLFGYNTDFNTPYSIGTQLKIYSLDLISSKISEITTLNSFSAFLTPIINKLPFTINKDTLYTLNAAGTSLLKFNLHTQNLSSLPIINLEVLKMIDDVLKLVQSGIDINKLQQISLMPFLAISPIVLADDKLYFLVRKKVNKSNIALHIVNIQIKTEKPRKLAKFKDRPLRPNTKHFPMYIATNYYIHSSQIFSITTYPIKNNCHGFKGTFHRLFFPNEYFRVIGLAGQQIHLE